MGWALICLLLLVPRVLWAQTVVEVEVQGTRGVDSAIVLGEIRSKGNPYDRARVSEDTKRIFKLGYFDNIKVDKESVPGGVKLIFLVSEKPSINEIVVEGNKKIKKDKILEAITVKPNQPPDNKKIAESKRKITQLYAREGYPDAMVDTETRTKGDKRQLVFKINEKEGRVVKGVKFEGNTVFSDGKLRKMIKTKKKSLLSFLTGSGKFQEESLERDVAVITYNYLNKGYLRVRVGQPKIKFSKKKKGLIITFFIDEGEQYRIGDVSVEGDIITTKEEILGKFNTLKGNIYSQKILEEDLNKVPTGSLMTSPLFLPSAISKIASRRLDPAMASPPPSMG